MSDIDKRSLSERDICTKLITPALRDVADPGLAAGTTELTVRVHGTVELERAYR